MARTAAGSGRRREAGEPSPANRVIHHPSPRPARTSYFSKPAHRIAHRRVERRPGSIVTPQLSLPRPSSALPLGARDTRPAQSRDHSRSRDRCDGRGIRGDCVTVPPTVLAYRLYIGFIDMYIVVYCMIRCPRLRLAMAHAFSTPSMVSLLRVPTNNHILVSRLIDFSPLPRAPRQASIHSHSRVANHRHHRLALSDFPSLQHLCSRRPRSYALHVRRTPGSSSFRFEARLDHFEYRTLVVLHQVELFLATL